MLTHYGNFLCSLGGKDPFKTGFSLSEAAFRGVLFLQLTVDSLSDTPRGQSPIGWWNLCRS